MSTIQPTPLDRYQVIVAMLRQILVRLDALEQHVDQIDLTLRPHGDGTTIRPRRRQ